MTLDAKTIRQVAELARLAITDEEAERYATQLSVVFGYFEQLNEVNTDDVEETCQVTGLTDIVREDTAASVDEQTRRALIDQFSDWVGDLLRVPGVFTKKEDQHAEDII